MWMYLAVAVGGAFGALARFSASKYVAENFSDLSFPLATFSVNMIGSFLLGFSYVLSAEKMSLEPHVAAVITVGFLGSFTTFSTMSLDFYHLLAEAKYLLAGIYIASSVFLGLIAASLGIIMARLF
ncbi:fluoride efflux transporter CrcB [uncultured Umboniibacter sp.]|uniref:fluoride efflux transporter CrcB n=1 Tax=uncultured Umboniibacter sp. TaxID=1798917 RepID=UPI002629A106|nr:fluoride efflux transporter CrcB [uncultured Umboniibacter sp.]